MTTKIQVTKADIDLAIQQIGSRTARNKCCPIYQAVKRQNIFPDKDFMVCQSTIELDSTYRKLAILPEEAKNFISRFDQRVEVSTPEPFEFEIEIINEEPAPIKASVEGC